MNKTTFQRQAKFVETLSNTKAINWTAFESTMLDKVFKIQIVKNILDKTILISKLDDSLFSVRIKKRTFYFIRLFSIIGAVCVISSLVVIGEFKVSLIMMLGLFFVAATIGWILPEMYIKDRIKYFEYQVLSAVPDFLEELHMVTASAGFESFGQAIQVISKIFPGEMGEKLKSLVAIEPYVSDEELLETFVKECPDPLITELLLTFSLANTFGGNISEKTKELASYAQVNREQRAKEIGNKTSGLLLGPLLIFHFPALLIIFLIPFLFMLQKGL